MHRNVADVSVENARRPGGRKDEPHQQLERGRFPCAIRAQKTKDLMGLDSQRKTIKRPHFSLAPESDFVIFRQVIDFDYRHITCWELPPRHRVTETSRKKRRCLAVSIIVFSVSASPCG